MGNLMTIQSPYTINRLVLYGISKQKQYKKSGHFIDMLYELSSRYSDEGPFVSYLNPHGKHSKFSET